MHSNLRNVDLNLLLVFDAIHRHRSVADAADELAMSPSACSHALTRLRQALADELFVRYGSAMQPTPLAAQMADDVSAALRLLGSRLGSRRQFDPRQSDDTFILAATDYTAFALLPSLTRQIGTIAPHIRLKVVYSNHRDALDDLAAGRVHFSLGFSNAGEQVGGGIESIDCFEDDYVVLASAAHPRLGKRLSLERYLAERHVMVLPWADAPGVIDQALERLNLRRDVGVQLPSVLAAPFIVADSEYLATLPRRAAQDFLRLAQLQVFEAPFDTPRYQLKALFHPRHGAGAGHRWMREQIALAFAGN